MKLMVSMGIILFFSVLCCCLYVIKNDRLSKQIDRLELKVENRDSTIKAQNLEAVQRQQVIESLLQRVDFQQLENEWLRSKLRTCQ